MKWISSIFLTIRAYEIRHKELHSATQIHIWSHVFCLYGKTIKRTGDSHLIFWIFLHETRIKIIVVVYLEEKLQTEILHGDCWHRWDSVCFLLEQMIVLQLVQHVLISNWTEHLSSKRIYIIHTSISLDGLFPLLASP